MNELVNTIGSNLYDLILMWKLFTILNGILVYSALIAFPFIAIGMVHAWAKYIKHANDKNL